MSSVNERLVFIGVRRTAVALDRQTGREIWADRPEGRIRQPCPRRRRPLRHRPRRNLLPRPLHRPRPLEQPAEGMGWGIVTLATLTGSIAPAMAQMQAEESASGG